MIKKWRKTMIKKNILVINYLLIKKMKKDHDLITL